MLILQTLRKEYNAATGSGVPLTDVEHSKCAGRVYTHHFTVAMKFVKLAGKLPNDPIALDSLIQAVWQVIRRMTCTCQSLVVDFFCELLALLKVGPLRDPTRVNACFEIRGQCNRVVGTEGCRVAALPLALRGMTDGLSHSDDTHCPIHITIALRPTWIALNRIFFHAF